MSLAAHEFRGIPDNGVWQAALSPTPDGNFFGAAGTTNWSVSGSDTLTAPLYGNAESGPLSVSGSGTDSYDYWRYATFDGSTWMPTSGAGWASGSGSLTFSFSANSGYSTIDPNWTADVYASSPGPIKAITATGTHWSGTTSASAAATTSYGYATTSTFDGVNWISNGSASASAAGWTNSNFSADSPFTSHWGYGLGNDDASVSGTVSGSGSDWSTYGYSENQTLSGNTWAWASGTGGGSGGASAHWWYNGGGNFSQQTGGAGSASGTISGVSGREDYSLDYHTTATNPLGTGWTQSGGGNVSATTTYHYSYSGSGGGSVPVSPSLNWSGATWNISDEHGSGGGTYTLSDPLSFDGAVWTNSPNLSGSATQEDYFHYRMDWPNPPGSTTTITDVEDQISTTHPSGWGDGVAMNPTYSGSGVQTWTPADGDYSSYAWSPSGDGKQVYETRTKADGTTIPAGPFSSIPDLMRNYDIFGDVPPPGNDPGRYGTYVVISLTGVATLAVDLPGARSGNSGIVTPPSLTNWSIPTYFAAPTLPGESRITDVTGVGSLSPPGLATDMLNTQTSASALSGFLPTSPPPSVTTAFGMNNVAVAGYSADPALYRSITTPIQTSFAWGNAPGATGFTSETLRGAGAAFGSSIVAPAFPETHSLVVVGYGSKNVSAGSVWLAAPAIDTSAWQWSNPDPSTDPLTNSVVPVCFPPGTPILMEDGTTKVIERIEAGDRVKGAPHDDPEEPISAGEVVEVYHHGPRNLVEVEIGGHVIRCTPKHPFYVRARGFTAAAELKPDDELRTASGGWVAVGSVMDKGEVKPVYNFHVAGLHTYFVRNGTGSAEVLVHNDSGDDEAADPDPGATMYQAYRDLAAEYRFLYEQYRGENRRFLEYKYKYCRDCAEQALKYGASEDTVKGFFRDLRDLENEVKNYEKDVELGNAMFYAYLKKHEEDLERTPLREVQGFVWDAPVSMITGLVDMVTDLPGTAKGLWYAANHLDQVWGQTVEDFNKPGGKGRAAFDVATFFLPVGKANRARKAAELSEIARAIAKAERYAAEFAELAAKGGKAAKWAERAAAVEYALAKMKWGEYLRTVGKDALGLTYPGERMNGFLTHAHHIVPKVGNEASREAVEKAQAILRKYGINPYFDPRNLVWAPNQGHSTQYVLDVLKALEEADAKATSLATRAEKVALIERTLRDLAIKYKRGFWRPK